MSNHISFQLKTKDFLLARKDFPENIQYKTEKQDSLFVNLSLCSEKDVEVFENFLREKNISFSALISSSPVV